MSDTAATVSADQTQAAIDTAIAAGWRRRLDTQEIANRLRLPESTVANRLARLRDARHLT